MTANEYWIDKKANEIFDLLTESGPRGVKLYAIKNTLKQAIEIGEADLADKLRRISLDKLRNL